MRNQIIRCINYAAKKDKNDALKKNNHYNPCRWTALWSEHFLSNLKNNKKHGSCQKAKVKYIDLETGEIDEKLTKKIFLNKNQFKYNIDNLPKDMLLEFIFPSGTIFLTIQQLKKIVPELQISDKILQSTFEGNLTVFENFLFPTLRKMVVDINNKCDIRGESQIYLCFLIWFQFVRCYQAIFFNNKSESESDFLQQMTPDKANIFIWGAIHSEWKIYQSKDFNFPMGDMSVITMPHFSNVEKILMAISPELLLEINMSKIRLDSSIIFENASQEIIDEYNDECIKHSFRYIMSSDYKTLEKIRNSKLYHKRRKELGYI